MTKTLSIIIVNYNGAEYIRACLDSVERFSPPNSEIIVVDNNSVDSSVSIIEKYHPRVKLIQSSHNLGFTGGNNLGAHSSSGELLLLLNSDTILQSPIFPVVDLICNSPEIGVVGCRLIYPSQNQQESIGNKISPLVLALGWTPLSRIFSTLRRTIHSNSNVYLSEFFECDWLSGAFLLTRRNLWHELKGLDQNYFMYMEDVDYCRRVRSLGFRVIYSALTTVIHLEGAGKPWIGEKALLNTIYSYKVYCKKFYGPFSSALLLVSLSFIFFGRAAMHIIIFLFSFDLIHLKKCIGFLKGSIRSFKLSLTSCRR